MRYFCISSLKGKYMAQERSELAELMRKNAFTEAELTEEERKKAKLLITNAAEAGKNCWLHDDEKSTPKSIYDLGLCKNHAYHTLITRK